MLNLIILNAILLLIIIFILIFFYKNILIYIDGVCEYLRNFILKNNSFFTILFLLLFFIEQMILLGLIFYYKEKIDIIRIIVSGFALIVITTATLQKIILEVRVTHFKEMGIMGKKTIYMLERWLDKYKKR